MPAESLSSDTNEIAEKLRVAKIDRELASGALPQVVETEWGPRRNRDDFEPIEPPTPDGLTYSA